MIASLAHIRRYPIKSIGGEGLDSVTLKAGHRLPGDREWAVLTSSGEKHASKSETEGEPDIWLPKSCFLRGAVSASLQAVRGGWQDGKIMLSHPDREDLIFSPESEGDSLIEWLQPLWPEEAPAPTRLVKGAAIWTDSKKPFVSILSIDSLLELETKIGWRLGTDRWRGNLWVKGMKPFAERDLIGETMRIGNGELRIVANIGRCAATNADTETGQPDIEMVNALNHHYDHSDFGVYAEVINDGTVTTGDEVTI